ncbi:MAG: T9SS type A sorting domain-containing protein [Bacteroidia bacterium]
MKKLLICGLALTFGMTAMAQAPNKGKTVKGLTLQQKGHVVNGETKTTPSTAPAVAGLRKGNNPPSAQAVNVIPVGQSANAFGTAFGAKTALFAHPVINSVSLVYRSAPAVTGDISSGCLRFASSTDGGATWGSNLGPLYTSNGTNAAPLANARYPQAIIYNPAGNTVAANASVSYFAPTLAGFGPGANSAWGGHAHGTAIIGGGTGTMTEDLDANNGFLIPDGGALNTDDNTFWICNGYFDVVTGDYADTLLLAKGVWSAGDYSFTYQKIAAPIAPDVDGTRTLIATSIAWGSGGIGYVSMLAHDDYTTVLDSNAAPIVYKTADNGATWIKVASLDMSSFDALFQFGVPYTTAFELDMSVDNSNNAHLVFGVGALGASAYSMNTGAGSWGLFDVSTSDGGETWGAQLLATPQTFRGEFADATNTLQEDSRPQISRTLDGTKLFFSWFDTDTTLFFTTDNLFPDVHTVGLNNSTGLWTAETNLTAGSSADGICIFGNVSPFTLDGAAGCYEVPVSILALTGGGPSSQTDHSYLDGLEICDAAFTVAGTPTPIANFVQGIGVVENNSSVSFDLGQNFPNPFNGSTQFSLNLVKSSDVTVEVYNVLGKLVKTNSYENLQAGVNTIAISASDLSAGMYSYRVIVGSEMATRTMIVK